MQSYSQHLPTSCSVDKHVNLQLTTAPSQRDFDIQMRPISDKDMEVFDLDHLLEEYLETDMLQQLNDSTADRSSSGDLAHLFQSSSSNESDSFVTSLTLDRDAKSAWHKALERCEQNPASSKLNDSSSFFIASRAKESLSDSELLNFEDFFELERNQLRSISQPSTPRPHIARSVKKAVSFTNRTLPRGVQKTPKKSPATPFAKMMQPSYHRSPISDIWTRKMIVPVDSFDTDILSGASSPSPSTKLLQSCNINGVFAQDHQPYTHTRTPLASPHLNTSEMNFSNYHLTPQASPAVEISDNNNPFSDDMGLAFSSSASSAALSALQTPPSSLQLPMTTWEPDVSPRLEFAFSAGQDFSTAKTAGWWNDDVTHSPAGPIYRESNSRSTSQNLSLSTASMAGLGITCDTSMIGDFESGLDLSMGESVRGASASSLDMESYGAMYPTPPQQHIVPIGHRPLSRSPSPCVQPRFHRRRPSSHSHTSHHRTSQIARRKSSNGSAQTASRQLSSGDIGFVNYTPDDSCKILTGVAPSGSSKTKARREKEAAEKRRKLSQAAIKAVREAGGDVDSLRRLEREELFDLES